MKFALLLEEITYKGGKRCDPKGGVPKVLLITITFFLGFTKMQPSPTTHKIQQKSVQGLPQVQASFVTRYLMDS